MVRDSSEARPQRTIDPACGIAQQRTIDLDCGITLQRIAQWLDDELALPREGQGYVFRKGACACTVTLERLENRTIGLLDLERTRLLVCGDSEAVDVFEKLFTLRFMSAGG